MGLLNERIGRFNTKNGDSWPEQCAWRQGELVAHDEFSPLFLARFMRNGTQCPLPDEVRGLALAGLRADRHRPGPGHRRLGSPLRLQPSDVSVLEGLRGDG